MLELPVSLQDLLTGPAVLAALAGLVLGRLVAGLGGGGGPRRTDEADRRLRASEAELRVAQRTIEEQRAALEAAAAEHAALKAELDAAREQAETREERLRRARAELQTECAKTAKLRQELAERAEEMVRTHVQLRDVTNELGVARVGSDVILEQIARLEQERDDLNTLVGSLRDELVSRALAGDAPPAGGRDPVLGG